MLERQSVDSGWQVTLCSQGVARYFAAAFLAVWCCGWAAGELFALTLLLAALRAVLGPGFLGAWLPAMTGSMPSGGALPFFFVFLAVWLPLWTLGGLFAIRELLGLLFGREVLRWGPDGLVVERHALFLLSTVRFDPSRVTRFATRARGLYADERARAACVTRLGSADDRAALAAELEEWRKSMGPPLSSVAGEPPIPDWVVTRDESGAEALEPSPRTRQCIGIVLALLGPAFLYVLAIALPRATGAAIAIEYLVLGLPGLVLCYGGAWLLAVHESWRPRHGTLERRRSALGRTWTRAFTPLGLELRSSTDSDGDTRWALVVTGGGRAQTMATSLHDPNAPLSLGTWLAERTGVELVSKAAAAIRKAG